MAKSALNQSYDAIDRDMFCETVGRLVLKDYGIQDGGDLCYNLLEQGEVDMDKGAPAAAAQVAQLIQQA